MQQININEKTVSPTDARNILSECSLDSAPTKTFNEISIAQRLIIVLIVKCNLIFINDRPCCGILNRTVMHYLIYILMQFNLLAPRPTNCKSSKMLLIRIHSGSIFL